MIFFRTRYEVKQLQEQIAIMERKLDRFFNTYNGTVKLVDEVTKLIYEHSAETRKNAGDKFRGGTFKLQDMKPEYGDNWKEEENKLNKRSSK